MTEIVHVLPDMQVCPQRRRVIMVVELGTELAHMDMLKIRCKRKERQSVIPLEASKRLVLWQNENPAVFRDIGGTGCRKPVVSLKKYKIFFYGPVWWSMEDGKCALSTILHIIE